MKPSLQSRRVHIIDPVHHISYKDAHEKVKRLQQYTVMEFKLCVYYMHSINEAIKSIHLKLVTLVQY